jgi:hypothetical protein
MARTIVRLAEDQWRNVVFSLDEPRSTVNYTLLLPVRSFSIADVGGQRLLHIPDHGLKDGQAVAVGTADPDDRLPAGLRDDLPYFVREIENDRDHVSLSTAPGGPVEPIYNDGQGEPLLFAWLDKADLCRLPPVATGDPLVRVAGEMLFRGLVRNRDLGTNFTAARGQHATNSICFFFGDVTRRIVESFPWEALYHPEEQFLALQQKWPIVRLKDPQASVIESFAYDPPLRIFAVMSATGPRVDPTSEWEGLYAGVRDRDVMVRVLTCEPELIDKINGLNDWRFSAGQTVDGDNILQEFRRFTPQILHLFGHGNASRSELVFGNRVDLKLNQRGSITIGAANIRQFASDTVPVWITILNACRSAASPEGPENLTSALARSGFPVVIGMSADVASQHTEVFARTYYRSILEELDTCQEWKPHATDWAGRLWQTRLAIQSACRATPEACPQWTVPIFYTRIQPFRLIRIGSDQPHRNQAPPIQPLSEVQAALNSDANKELGMQGLRALVNR